MDNKKWFGWPFKGIKGKMPAKYMMGSEVNM